MTETLFAPVWWMLVGGVVAAVGLFVYASSRLNNRLRLAGVGLLLAVVVWFALGRYVQTPVESARDGTRAFVAAVVARDTAIMDGLLSPGVSLGRFGKTDILATTPVYADRWGLQTAYVSGTEVEPRGPQLLSRIRVISTHEAGKSPAETLPTDWEFVWAKEPAGWRIIQITPLRIGSTDVGSIIESHFSRR